MNGLKKEVFSLSGENRTMRSQHHAQPNKVDNASPSPWLASRPMEETTHPEETPVSLQAKSAGIHPGNHLARISIFPPMQTKLTVGAPDDQYEQEADQVADQVMSMAPPAPVQQLATESVEVQRTPLAATITPLVQREMEEEEPLQTKAIQRQTNPSTAPTLETRLNQSKGSGSPLPDETRSFMESCFGTDFSQVRIHTDSASVQMNRELSAQAFTHGGDIYFGAGKFDPSSDSGKHLLAHELTHVVQQTGAAQRKLVQRDLAADLRDFANYGEQDQQAQMQQQPPPAMQVNNIQDAREARSKLSEIEGFRPNMQSGGRTGTISGAQISANEGAIAALSDYLVTVGEQGRTLSTFQQQLQQVRRDYGRVSGQMIHLEAMGVVDRGQTAAFRAEQIVGAATGARSAEASAAGIRGDAAVIRQQVQTAHDTLMGKGNDVSRTQREANIAVHRLNSALSNLNSGIIPRETDPALAAQQRAIKAKVSTMQSRLSTGLQVLAALGGAAGLGTAATAAATDAFGSTLTGLGQQALGGVSTGSIATAISEEWYREETNQIEAQIAQANAQSREAAITVNLSQVREAQTALFSALRSLEEKMTEYHQARDTLRTALANFGAAADQQGGGRRRGYTIIAGLLGDVDVLTVQITTTIGLGQTEEHAAGQATEARGRVEGTRNRAGQREGGVTYYQPYLDFQLANFGRSGGLVYKAFPNQIYFVTNDRSPGSAYGGQGAANPIVRQAIEELQQMRQVVQGMRDVLSRSLGISMQR